MDTTADYSLLFGRFYPEYDIVSILLLAFIIPCGMGNWAIIWCYLKTKSLRNPINMIVIALSFANGVDTTISAPMTFSRILMSYPKVSIHWCNTIFLLKNFCYAISLMTMFSLAAMRLRAGLMKTPEKPTFKKIGKIIIAIYSFAIVTAPFNLEKTSRMFRSCIGNPSDALWIEILQNEGILSTDMIYTSDENEGENITHHDDLHSAMSQEVEPTISSVSNFSNVTFPNNDSVTIASKLPEFWVCYLIVSVILYLGTIICYISLIVIIKRHNNAMKGMILGKSKDILTLRITIYVTCIFSVSFLAPFIPGLTLYPQRTAGVMHFISIFHIMTHLDAAFTPIIVLSNPVYRKALLQVMPHCIKRCFCLNTQSAPTPPSLPSVSSGTLPAVSTHVV